MCPLALLSRLPGIEAMWCSWPCWLRQTVTECHLYEDCRDSSVSNPQHPCESRHDINL